MGYLDHSLQPRNDLLLNSATAFGSLFSLSLYGAVKDKKKTFTHNSYDVVASSFSCHVFFLFFFFSTLWSQESLLFYVNSFVPACITCVCVCVQKASAKPLACLLVACCYIQTQPAAKMMKKTRERRRRAHIFGRPQE